MEKRLSHYNAITTAAICVIFLTVLYILREMGGWLQPLFIALFLYYISVPPVQFLVGRGFSEGWAHVTIVGGMALLGVGGGWIIGMNMASVVEELPLLQKKLASITLGVSRTFSEIPFLQKGIRSSMVPATYLAPPDQFLKAFLNQSSNVLSAGSLVFFFFIFIVREAKSLPSQLERAMGSKNARKIIDVMRQINRDIIQYLYVKFLASLIMAVVVFFLLLAFGIPLPFLWSTLAFVTNFVPYVGSIFSTLLVLMVALLHLDSWMLAISLCGTITVCDMFVGNYWEPRYTGYRLNVSPLLVLVSLCFWGWLWGPVGLILAVPITVSIRYVLENLPSTRAVGILMSCERRKNERVLVPAGPVVGPSSFEEIC